MPLIRPAQAARFINRCISPLGVSIVRSSDHDWSDTENFIPYEATAERAREAGMEIEDYVENVMNGVPGTSRATVDAMTTSGMFERVSGSIVEIGPGTGRYLSKVLPYVHDQPYEIYETSRPWREYLTREYGVLARPTDGFKMAATKDSTVHLAHAHKVFSTIPFMATCCYWQEFARVVRPGGWLAFDIMTEECLEAEQVTRWVTSEIRNGSFPATTPKKTAVAYFGAAGFTLMSSDLLIPMPPGKTQLLIFQRV